MTHTHNTKRVLMLVENNPFRRDVRVRQEAQALIHAGYQVSVICPAANGQSFHEVFNGVDIYCYPSPYQGKGFLSYIFEYGYSLLSMFSLTMYLYAYRGFDIIHAANPPDTAVLIAVFYKLLGKQFIFDHHDLAPEVFKVRFDTEKKVNQFIYQILIYMEYLSCKFADHVIATNQSFKLLEMERNNVPGERITIVRNGPDLDRLKLVDPISEIQRKGKATIVYLGIMGFQDGVDHLLKALYHLVNDLVRNDFYCVIAGGGDALPSLKLQAEQLGIIDFVMFTDFIEPEDVFKYISTAEICVAPEPSNLLNDRLSVIKISEYMALGKPIVAFDLPEHRVTAQDAALFARPGDDLDFAQKIVTLLDDPEQCKRMGKAGRERIENELAWSYQKKHLLEAYEKVINAKV
jgi:glycosyltransferase involved in cell wall biosynthesis